MARDDWLETPCSECRKPIHYHVNWNRVPRLCKSCLDAKKSQWHKKTCQRCGTIITYHVDWQNIPNLCKECNKKHKQAKAQAQAKWKEKSCKRCTQTIRYHEDWERVPEYCQECNKILAKRCEAKGCREEIHYKIYWEHIPQYCWSCKTGQRPVKEKRYRDDGGWDLYTGWGYVNNRGLIIFVDNGPHGKHSHAVYDAHGKRIGYRKEGADEHWNDETSRKTSRALYPHTSTNNDNTRKNSRWKFWLW